MVAEDRPWLKGSKQKRRGKGAFTSKDPSKREQALDTVSMADLLAIVARGDPVESTA